MKTKCFQAEKSFLHVFCLFAQNLVKHEDNVFSSRKVVFFTKLTETHEKRSILNVKSNSGYYII